VPGRPTGAWRSTPVAVLRDDGQRYLVARSGRPTGLNLRAAGAGRLSRGGTTEEIGVTEVPVSGRPPIIAEYWKQFGRMPRVAKSFRVLPDPADHPTFLITE